MRKAFVACVALLCAVGVQAEERIIRPDAGPVRVQMDAVPIAALVSMLMRDVLKVPYSIAPEVLRDTRPVSVNLTLPRDDLPVSVVRYLRGLGLSVNLSGGTVFVNKAGASGASMQASGQTVAGDFTRGIEFQSPVGQAPISAPSAQAYAPAFPPGVGASHIAGTEGGDAGPQGRGDILIIKPAFRSVDELAQLLEPLFPNVKIAFRTGSAPKDQQVVGQVSPDVLAVTGEPKDLERLRKVVKAVDLARPVVSVRAVIVQVSSSSNSGSALSAVVNFLGGKLQLGLSVAAAATAPDNFVKLTTPNISAVIGALRSDGRFKVVAEPSLLVLSGSTATLNSGAQVPTLASVSYDSNGTPVRSVVYRDSGVTLTVAPHVRAGEIELDLRQERSSFAQTETGVNDSPTLNKSSASSRFAIAQGETVAVASLGERSTANGRSGLFERFMPVRSSSASESQLVVLLTAETLAAERKGEAEFLLLPFDGEKAAAETERSDGRRRPAA